MEFSILNFRELGAYPTLDGRTVKKGYFFRGGPLTTTDPKEQKAIADLKFKYIFDFRSKAELAKSEAEYIPNGTSYVQCSANHLLHEKRLDDLDFTKPDFDADLEEWLINSYKDMPFENQAYRNVFDVLRRKQAPFYFHCSAGKDRTGICAALILLLLGCSEEVVYEDYLKSYDNMLQAMPDAPRTSLVFKEWLEGALNTIKDKYGNYDSFFLNEFGIDEEERDDLKAYYLE